MRQAIHEHIRNITKHLPKVLGAILLLALFGYIAIPLILRVDWSDWTGFNAYTTPQVGENQAYQREKTFWDWMQLLIVPGILLWAATQFNNRNTRTQLEVTVENQREAALQHYIDSMSTLLLHEGLRTLGVDDEIRSVARARTLAVLRVLDGKRKGIVVEFLSNARLLLQENVISLSGVDLRGIELKETRQAINVSEADLSDADFTHARLSGLFAFDAILTRLKANKAVLHGAQLTSATLDDAQLEGTNLQHTDLSHAKLNRANLRGADLYAAQVNHADLSGADLRDVQLFGNPTSRYGSEAANFSYVILRGADLRGTNLNDVDLTGAVLTGAKVSMEQLKQARSLKGAILPDGTTHD